MKLAILYEDNEYVFINKPSGILSIPDRHNAEIPNITGALRKIYGNIFIVHRLDRETSGCICFAKDEATHRYTSKLFETRDVEKFYRGIIHGTPPTPNGRIEEAIMEHPTIKGKMIIKNAATAEKLVAYFLIGDRIGAKMLRELEEGWRSIHGGKGLPKPLN